MKKLGRPRIYSDEERKNRSKENSRKYKEFHPEKIRAAQKKYYYKNLDSERLRSRNWGTSKNHYAAVKKHRDNNPGFMNAQNGIRRALKLQATPKWLTKEQIKQIENFYKNCPKGYEVDHIIPLNGKNVRGLHVVWNLQYLTKKENVVKRNKFDGTYENNGWRINL